jgi:hypothetical protein
MTAVLMESVEVLTTDMYGYRVREDSLTKLGHAHLREALGAVYREALTTLPDGLDREKVASA